MTMARWIVAAWLCMVLAGCSSQKQGAATGTVTVSGVPLEAGLITFIGEEEPFALENAGIRQGRFKTADMPAGRYTVVIKIIDAGAAGAAKPERDLAPGAPAKPRSNKSQPNPRYEDPAQSGLTHTITAGSSQCDFNLEPK